MIDILDKIRLNKRLVVEELKAILPAEQIRDRFPGENRLSWRDAISQPGRTNIIAECKKASPSKGILKLDFDIDHLASQYREGGAVALSVLTEEHFFLGKAEYMKRAKDAARLPVLCKDFIFDPYQILYARYMHADAILLIVAMLTPTTLVELLAEARSVGVDALVEVHDDDEASIAIDSGADIIGVNNRNLRDFTVTLETAERIGARINGDHITVAESGLSTSGDLRRLRDLGFDAFLIGEALVTAADPASKLRELTE